jgi:hypothetical protein
LFGTQANSPTRIAPPSFLLKNRAGFGRLR